LNKINEKSVELYVKMKNELRTTPKTTKSSKAFAGFLTGLVFIRFTTPLIFGDATTLFSDIEAIMGDLYAALFSITTGIAALMVLCALIVIMVTNNQRTTETAKMWAKRIIIVWVVINLLGYGFDILNEVTHDGDKSTWNEITQ
jgi:hypothetical protein